MREVTFNEWCEAIDTEVAERRKMHNLTSGYFRDAGTNAMEYVSRGRVIARAEGYDHDDKHYYVQEEMK